MDSTYATAHAALAHALVLSSDNAGASRRARLKDAEQEARTAIRLDSLLADAHAALGHVFLFDYQFASAQAELKRAVDLDPTDVAMRPCRCSSA